MQRVRYLKLFILLPVIVTGCATVDVQPDYRRAGEYISRTTGHSGAPPADEQAVIDLRVSQLLADGITEAEAVEVCLINNSGFQAMWMDIGMARADLVQAGLLSNPTLGVSVRLPSGGGLANLEASLAQNIAELWQMAPRKRGAEHALNQAILELALQASILASETRATYYRAVGTMQSYEIAMEHEKIADRLLDTAIIRREAGAGSELDVNLARSAGFEARLLCETQRFDHAEAVRDLARLLGLTQTGDSIVFADEIPLPPSHPLDSQRMVDAARRNRLDIQVAGENVATTAASVSMEQRQFLRELNIGVEIERGERPPGEARDGSNVIFGPSIGLEIPVFDQNQARIAKARFAHDQAVHMLNAVDRQMVQDVRSAVDRAHTASRILHLAVNEFVPLAQKNLDLSTESYRAGKASVLSVLEAQRFLLDSRRRHVFAQVDAAAALADVERVVGLPLERIAGASNDAAGPPEEPLETTNGDQR